MTTPVAAIQSVQLDDEQNALILLDQTLLPNEKVFLQLTTVEEIWDAIYRLKVRGAPAIGIAAAYGVYLGTKQSNAATFSELSADFQAVKQYLASSRPTAVNLFWALNRMEERLKKEAEKSVQEIKDALRDEAESIRLEDEKICYSIGEHALSLLQPGWGLLTHCNAGTIATAKYGTALAPIYLGQEQGYDFQVFADETRPLLQGARLTAWELQEAGVDVTLICDNMASHVMKEGKVQAVLTGCDRVAANGDTANKIGTSGLAVLAKHYGIPFYICAPLSTIDFECKTGEDIPIELRKPEEITTTWYEKPMAPENVKAYNPAFDITDHELITGIVTEKGIAYPPYQESLAYLRTKD
ncbi:MULTISPECIES: S-methyl-5-thioribose-1-phosphate isomerase [Bacillus]|uniref:Methylthioribose-1-phosphate isomerase n=2 Tax=Bacillus TaxID=1386 RepID=A0A0M4FZM7_9BACI|nr:MULTISPECIES: S-methyl-5-thioribose-1-phosphate isomerase [Bacillus]ALC83075.1 methylthioribose-1-phosphate isomerase [Bacillus gobiensis]MBP1082119.1 methylthioribose-1-phosphate isomerase [Bacillus capparidis]MED1096742.1 S-methyl-5-thioribose-1-phosphate isomerase [Bacillus capparidis]